MPQHKLILHQATLPSARRRTPPVNLAPKSLDGLTFHPQPTFPKCSLVLAAYVLALVLCSTHLDSAAQHLSLSLQGISIQPTACDKVLSRLRSASFGRRCFVGLWSGRSSDGIPVGFTFHNSGGATRRPVDLRTAYVCACGPPPALLPCLLVRSVLGVASVQSRGARGFPHVTSQFVAPARGCVHLIAAPHLAAALQRSTSPRRIQDLPVLFSAPNLLKLLLSHTHKSALQLHVGK